MKKVFNQVNKSWALIFRTFDFSSTPDSKKYLEEQLVDDLV